MPPCRTREGDCGGLQQLRAYYQKHDPAKADHVVDIFDKWDATELEKGLQRRYGESLEGCCVVTPLNCAASLLSPPCFCSSLMY